MPLNVGWNPMLDIENRIAQLEDENEARRNDTMPTAEPTGESLADLINAHPDEPTPLCVFGYLLRFVEEVDKNNAGRNQRLAALEKEMAAIRAAFEEQRLRFEHRDLRDDALRAIVARSNNQETMRVLGLRVHRLEHEVKGMVFLEHDALGQS